MALVHPFRLFLSSFFSSLSLSLSLCICGLEFESFYFIPEESCYKSFDVTFEEDTNMFGALNILSLYLSLASPALFLTSYAGNLVLCIVMIPFQGKKDLCSIGSTETIFKQAGSKLQA